MRTLIGLLVASMIGLLSAETLGAQENDSPDLQMDAVGPTPPRLSFVDGQVSFLRPGSPDWTQAQVNMPLAPGDELYTGSPGNLEIQIGARAFLRAWANTQIAMEHLGTDYLRFKVTAGHASFDLWSLETGHTVEVATPNAAITIDRPGYYRADIIGERTAFTVRRSGRAFVTSADGESISIAPNEEGVVDGVEHPTVSSYSAPPLDPWDNWNYARTERLLDAESARYVPQEVYGTSDLDQYGRWRVVPDYGPVWVPTGVPAGWAPYSTGAWALDPYYGWTWVDTAPWGWAPYHYGRWVRVNNDWCWAPGPIVTRPVYAPALVAFFGGPQGSVVVGASGPVVGWVALGWGEPCIPWWGRPGFIHRPWWGGWAGPRVVNNVVVQRTTLVKVEEIRVYRNAGVRNAVVGAHEDQLHRGGFPHERFARLDAKDLQPLGSAPRVRGTPANAAPAKHVLHPPDKDLRRPVVETRPPHAFAQPVDRAERKPDAARAPAPGPHIVPRPQLHEKAAELPRPAFGQSTREQRSLKSSAQPPATPESPAVRRSDPTRQSQPAVTRPLNLQPQPPQHPDRSGRSDRPGRPEPAVNPLKLTPAANSNRIERPRATVQQLAGQPTRSAPPPRTETIPLRRPERRDLTANAPHPKAAPGNAPQAQRPAARVHFPPGSPVGPQRGP